MVKAETHVHVGESASNGILILLGFILLLISWFVIPSLFGFGWAVVSGLLGLGMIILGFLRLTYI